MMDLLLDRRQFLTGATVASGVVLAESPSIPGEPASRPFIVDCQSHLFAPEAIEMMQRRTDDPSVYRKDGALWIKMGEWHRRLQPTHTDTVAKVAAMDANGIDVTALSINDPGPEWFGNDGAAVARMMHDFIADTTRKHANRFIGLCTLPLQNRREAERELDRCIGDLGMRGILLYSNLAGQWPDEPQFRWLFAAAIERDVPVLLHPAKPTTTEQVKEYDLTSTLGNMFENTIALARIIASGLLDEFPKLRLVSPHLGGTLPFIAGRMDHQIAVLKRSNQTLNQKPSDYMRQIYLDIVSPLPEAIRFAIDFSSVDHLLFSSDHPWVDPALILATLRSLKLPFEDENKILGGNARKLFRI